MILPHEVSIFHYFDKPIYSIIYLENLTDITKNFGMESFEWKNLSWYFYYDFLGKDVTFNYCIKFFSKRESLDPFLLWQLF